MIDQIKSNWGEEDLYGMTGRLMKSIIEKSISSIPIQLVVVVEVEIEVEVLYGVFIQSKKAQVSITEHDVSNVKNSRLEKYEYIWLLIKCLPINYYLENNSPQHYHP